MAALGQRFTGTVQYSLVIYLIRVPNKGTDSEEPGEHRSELWSCGLHQDGRSERYRQAGYRNTNENGMDWRQ